VRGREVWTLGVVHVRTEVAFGRLKMEAKWRAYATRNRTSCVNMTLQSTNMKRLYDVGEMCVEVEDDRRSSIRHRIWGAENIMKTKLSSALVRSE